MSGNFYSLVKSRNPNTPPPVSDDRYTGIEIEIEGVTSLVVPTEENQEIPIQGTNWLYKRDGSLRNNGMEFVTKPTHISDQNESLRVFETWKAAHHWMPSDRCGIHVHVDARDYTHAELKNLVTLYCLMEPLMFDFVGKEREESIFCVPWYRSQSDLNWYINEVYRYTRIADLGAALSRETCKYAALYLAPLATFGTVEFRHAPTWKDIMKTDTWAKMCVDVVNYAYTHDASQIVRNYESGPASLVSAVFKLSRFSPSRNVIELIEADDSDYLARKVVGLEPVTIGWRAPSAKRVIPKSKQGDTLTKAKRLRRLTADGFFLANPVQTDDWN